MTWNMYLGMIAFLTVMLSVLFIVAWPILGNVVRHYRKGRERRDSAGRAPADDDFIKWTLPIWKAVPPALAAAWLIVHFVVKP